MTNKPSQKIIDFIVADEWLEGKVVKGQGRAKTLGFPTINLLPINHQSLVINHQYGIYLCQVKIKQKTYQGLLHYGPRPTFDEKEPSLEIYVLDFHQTCEQGEKVQFKLIKYLRGIKKFATKKALIKQIKKDLKQVF